MPKTKRILFTALNWGLGHASRTIPLIQKAIALDLQPYLAAEGEALALWQEQFPNLPHIKLPPYNIRYPSQNMSWNMAQQLPQILRAMAKEQALLPKLVNKYQISVLLNDNRYGCYLSSLPSAFLGHQLRIAFPYRWQKSLLQPLNRFLLQKHKLIWLPDYQGEANLSGQLGQDLPWPNIRYIGPLSRLQNTDIQQKDYEIVALLSGPEPQRQYLEEELRQKLALLPQKSLIIRGKIRATETKLNGDYPHILPYATGQELASFLLSAKLLVLRAGYSSLMDLAQLKAGAMLLCPTPGQTEQEYLAQRLARQGRAQQQPQNQLQLPLAWAQKDHFLPHWPQKEQPDLSPFFQELLDLTQ